MAFLGRNPCPINRLHLEKLRNRDLVCVLDQSYYRQMAVYASTLDDVGRRVLRVIRERGVAPGSQVMSEAQVTAEELSKAAGMLIDSNLIKTNGTVSNLKEVEQAYFSILPSNATLAEKILSS